MAGSGSSWHKVPAGPLAGEQVFIPVALKGTLTEKQIAQQLAGGYGGWLNELPPGPLRAVRLSPPFHPSELTPYLKEVPLVVTQADGDHAVKKGQMQGVLAVVDTPFGHSIVHVLSGKALLYVGNKGKPTAQSEQQALMMMNTLNMLVPHWDTSDPEALSDGERAALKLAEGSPVGKFKVSKWVEGEGASAKKKPAPNDAAYETAQAMPAPEEAATSAPQEVEQPVPELAPAPLMIDEDEAAAMAAAPDAAALLVAIQVMPNVVDEQNKKAVEAEVVGSFALHPDLGGHGWTLTHVASGYPMATGFKTKEDAQEGLKLAAAAKVDWDYSDKKTLMANKTNFKKAGDLGKQLRALAEASTKPKPVKVEPPPWKPKGSVKNFPTLAAHEQAIQAAYKGGEGFVRGTALTKTTQKAIASYQNGGYGAINEALWGKGTGDAATKATVMKQIEQLDEAMSLSQVPFNMVVVRSQGQGSPLYQQMSVLEVGDIYETPAFDSSSINHNNTWGGGQVRVHYRLPKGAKAMFMNALSQSPNAPGYQSKHPSEHECLLARNSRWKLVGKEVDEQGRIQVTVELVEQVKPQKGAGK